MAVLSDFESEEEEDLYLMEENPKENLDVTSRGCFSRGFAQVTTQVNVEENTITWVFSRIRLLQDIGFPFGCLYFGIDLGSTLCIYLVFTTYFDTLFWFTWTIIKLLFLHRYTLNYALWILTYSYIYLVATQAHLVFSSLIIKYVCLPQECSHVYLLLLCKNDNCIFLQKFY